MNVKLTNLENVNETDPEVPIPVLVWTSFTPIAEIVDAVPAPG